MMLGAVVLLSLAASIVLAAALRRHVVPAYLSVPVVAVVPLAGWLLLQLTAVPERSLHEFEVLGQYHRLSDTIRIATQADADVVVRDGALSDLAVAVAFDAATGKLHTQVERSTVPVVLGGRPINAVALDRRAVISTPQGAARVIVRPWFCWRCDARYLENEDGTDRSEIRLGTRTRIAVGTDTVQLFRIGGVTYAAANPTAGVRVDDVPIPATLSAPADTLHLGWPAAERLLLRPVPVEHRLDVLFASSGARRWALPRPEHGDTIDLLVSATTADPLPGTMPVINPAAVAPGAASEPYGGALAFRNGAWSWLAAGVTRPIAAGVPVLLPGPQHDRAAGHIVRIRQFDTDPGAARWAVIAAWLAGAIALTLLWRHLHPQTLALRVLVVGGIYTLLGVRAVLASRAWLAPPYDASSTPTLLAALLAIPALVAALHLWTQYSTARLPRTRLLRESAVVAAPLLIGIAIVMPMVMPAWRTIVVSTTAATVSIALIGLVLLNRLLTGDRVRARTLPEPLAAVALPAQQSFTHRQFMYAMILLGMLGFLLLVVNQLIRYGTLVALVAWGTMAGVALLLTSGPRALVRPRSAAQPFGFGIAAGVVAGAIAWVLGLGLIAALLALLGAGAAVYAIRTRSTLRIRTIHVRDLAGPPLLLAIAVSLLAIVVPGAVGAARVVAEYALAIAGLIAITRIFTILWFRHTQQLAQHPHVRAARPGLPGALAVGAVLALLLGMIYVPLAVFDTGLVLIFFAATTTAICIGFYTMGARAIAIAVPAAVGIVFFLGMFVRPADLTDGSASLNTAQIRYAATYHPHELQRHMLTASDSRAVTTVRTLQQYWGVSHFAAGGSTGRGYFQAAYADWIVPRPVALTENVFSTFVLSEHGWLGGSAVLLCYLMIALALLYGAVRSCSRTATAPRALLLVGIAAFWTVPAFYIAAANGVLLPLTGQNMPLLGLLSSADVALGGWLAALGLVALPIDSDTGIEHVRSAGWTRRLRSGAWMVGGVFVAAWIALVVLLWRPTHAATADFALDGVIADVESLVEQGALQVVRTADGPDSIAIATSAAAHPLLVRDGFVRARVRRANSIARGEAPGVSCIDSDALVRARDDGSIAVFAALCALRSVAERREDWLGALSTDATRAEFVLSDGRAAVVLDPEQDQEAAIGGACARAGIARARTIRIGCTADAAVIRFGTSSPVLERTGTTAMELNGEVPVTPRVLRHADHLRVGGAADVWALELPAGALTYPRWENAAMRRIADPHVTPWLLQVDTQLARGMAHPDRLAWDAITTLYAPLHRELQSALADACADVPNVRRCSALIADPMTGEILALAATTPQPHRYLSADPNLRNHPAASAIKPIMAAAALAAHPQLRTLEVDHANAEYALIANTAVQPPLRAGRLYPAQRVPWRGFLGASDNLYAATLGFLATSAADGNGAPALRGTSDVSHLRLNGQPLRGQPTWVAAIGRMDLSTSPLATALRDLYGVHVNARETPAYDAAFWDAAVQAGAIAASPIVQRITPEPVSLDLNELRSPRQLAAFMIGGDRNRWNNIALAQALARIHSGRAVDLHVLRSVGPHTLAHEPLPFAGPDAAREAVLDAMAAVTDEPWGTAYILRNAFPAKVTWRAKTGTLLEREWIGSVFLFAGGPSAPASNACHTVGVITVELNRNGTPESRATTVFRNALAPLLQRHLGWSNARCTRVPARPVPGARADAG